MDNPSVAIRVCKNDLQQSTMTVGADHQNLLIVERIVPHREFQRVPDVIVCRSVLVRR